MISSTFPLTAPSSEFLPTLLPFLPYQWPITSSSLQRLVPTVTTSQLALSTAHSGRRIEPQTVTGASDDFTS